MDATTEWDLSVVVSAYESERFTPCDQENFEANFDKIAIYCNNDGEPTHAAKQLSNGRWSSKLGTLEDVEHDLPELEGSDPAYGKVQVLMKRTHRI